MWDDVVSGVGLTPGVVIAPPHMISDSTKSAVATVLAAIPPDKRGAIIGIATGAGMNVAVAVKVGDHFQVEAWIGKSGWDQPLDRGVAVQAVF